MYRIVYWVSNREFGTQAGNQDFEWRFLRQMDAVERSSMGLMQCGKKGFEKVNSEC